MKTRSQNFFCATIVSYDLNAIVKVKRINSFSGAKEQKIEILENAKIAFKVMIHFQMSVISKSSQRKHLMTSTSTGTRNQTT